MPEPKRPPSTDINALFRVRNQQIRQETSDVNSLMELFTSTALENDTKEGYESAIANIDKITGDHSYNKIKGKILTDQLKLEKENQVIFEDVQGRATNLLTNIKGGTTDGMMDLINALSTSITTNKTKFNENEITELTESLDMIEKLNILNQTKMANTQLDAILPSNPEDQVLEDFAQNIGNVSKSVQYTEGRVSGIGAKRTAIAESKIAIQEAKENYAGLGKNNWQKITGDLDGMNASIQNLKSQLGAGNFNIPIDFSTEKITGSGKDLVNKEAPKHILNQYDNAIISFAGTEMISETQKDFIANNDIAQNPDGTWSDEFILTIIDKMESGKENKLSERLEGRLGVKVGQGAYGTKFKSDYSPNLVSFWRKLKDARSDLSDIMKNPSNPSNPSNESSEQFDVMDMIDLVEPPIIK